MRLILLLTVALAGCGDRPKDIVTDQCLRIQLAQQCMSNLPAGPTATKYNDWAEVVEQCDRNSWSQSRRYREFVKPECSYEH